MNGGVCQRRWTLLRDNFKAQYFDNSQTDDQKDKIVPKMFYCKLQNLYKNYVMNKVNETIALEEFGNTSIDMESTIRSLLNNDDMIKVLSDNNNDDAFEKEKTSESQMLLRKIRALPENDVYIERFKTRIDPNTPFNKNYSYQTQQQSQKTYTRTKLNMDIEKTKKAINNLKDITILYPNDYKLDTCDLSNINQGDLSSCYIDNQTKSLNIPIDLEISADPGQNRSKYSSYQYLDNTTIEAVDKSSNIVDRTVEVPAKRIKIEKPSLQMPSASRSLYCDQQVLKELPLNHSSKTIVIKRLVKNVEIPVSQQPETFHSDWPIKFMLRYEADMRLLNNKVDKILQQITVNKKIVPPKQEANEDIY